MTGWVVTFYSYKGGVGRSALLANVATLLATWGYKTLCIDWDIEAPGLDEYFRPWLGEAAKPGLVELVSQFGETKSADWRDYVSEVPIPGAQGRLSLMTSGTMDDSFATRVQGVRWRDLYDKETFGRFLEQAREEWKQAFDFVLVDSRTGITDIGGICTVHLPDLVVPVFTANQQSLEGVSRVLGQAREQRSKLPLNRAALLTLPVPSRFDARGQDELAKLWLNKFAQRLEPVYENWLDLDVPARQILDFTKVPYFSSWTFGERLAVLEERDTDPERISYHFATIAALIARRLASSDELVRNRDGYVEAAKAAGKAKPAQDEPSVSQFAHDFYVSYAKSDDAVANEVVSLLRSVGCRVFTEGDVILGSDIRQSLYDALIASQHLLLLGHAQLSRWQRSEAEQFFEASRADSERKLVVLDLESTSGTSSGGALEAMNAVRLNARAAPLGNVLAELFVGDAATALREGRKVSIDREIRALADQYLAVPNESYATRVTQKDRLVSELGKLILARQVSRDALVSSKHEGLIAGLADAVQRRPETGDIQRLVDAGFELTRLHPAFRLLTAILTIWDAPGVGQVAPTSFKALLDHFTLLGDKRSDRPLLTLVETARRRLEHYS